jgi:M6 family metalloprotease-like protein
MPSRRLSTQKIAFALSLAASLSLFSWAAAIQAAPMPSPVMPPEPAGPPAPADATAKGLPPIDPQQVEDQDDMVWSDYHPIPGVDWTDPAKKATVRTIRVAMIVADFDDQPFVMTLPKHSDSYGNPQTDPIKREDIPQYYLDFWNGRSPAHNGHTANEYWMEQSHGRIGVSMDKFGPYRMPKHLYQYGLREWGAQNYGPSGVPIDGNVQNDCDALWRADAGANVRQNFDLVLRLFAGYDETSVWQEFGEMKFQTRDDITPEFGNPDPTKPRWAPTRYVPWTSWRAAEAIWSNAAILNSESSGAIIHEISHAAFRIGDNNNNPYATPYRRVGSGPWDIMDRGSFNGPGGPHRRWVIPAQEGGSMPAGTMLRQKINFGFVSQENVVALSREGLAKSGLAVATIMSRSAEPGPKGLVGFTVLLDGTPVPIPAAAQQGGGRGGGRGRGGAAGPGATTTPATTQEGDRGGTGNGTGFDPANAMFPALYPAQTTPAQEAATEPQTAPQTTPAAPGAGGRGGRGGGRGGGGGRGPAGGPAGWKGLAVQSMPQGMTNDRDPWEDPATHPFSEGIPNFSNYTVEVVQRIGYDSFCPDNGILIAKNKFYEGNNGGPNSYNCFNWVIDAHPEDANKLDFKRPNGEPVMRTIADYRQLNDALFHAGTNSGSQCEWEDTPNRLHFYIIDKQTDDKGYLSYTVAVRSLDGAGPQKRDVKLEAAAAPVSIHDAFTRCDATLTNTGEAAATDPALHPTDETAYLNSDVYRLSVSVDGAGWSADLQNALAALKFGDSQKVPVFVSHAAGSAQAATVTLKAVSESDPTKTATTAIHVAAN